MNPDSFLLKNRSGVMVYKALPPESFCIVEHWLEKPSVFMRGLVGVDVIGFADLEFQHRTHILYLDIVKL